MASGQLFVLEATTHIVYMNVGDYVELALFGEGNNSSSTLTATGDSNVSTVFSGYMVN
jgi:hypothetical protein